MPSPAVSAAARLPTSGWLKGLLLALLFCCVNSRICFAADTYTVTQNQQLNFGTLQKPSSGSQTWTVSTSGSTSGTGTLLYGIPANGDYTIKCTGTCTTSISLSLASPAFCSGVSNVGGTSAINYNNGEYSGPTPKSGLSNPGTGKDLKLGFGISYGSVGAGACAVSFDIVVNFSTNFGQTAALAFDLGLSMTKNADINFGTVTANNASTYRISTTGAVSVVSGTGTTLYGIPTAGSLTISGSTTTGITISTGAYTANNGVTPSNATCAYNGGASSSCDAGISGTAPGAGKTLLLGVTVAADGTQAAGTTAAPTFLVTVAYQ
jgi:hypothetical protein